MNGGFVKLHRYLADHPIFAQADVWQLFCYIVFYAQINKELKLIRNAKGLFKINLEPGEYFITRERLADYLQMSPRALDTRLKILKNYSLINYQPKNFGILITVSNWCDFSGIVSQNNQAITSSFQMINDMANHASCEANVKPESSESNLEVNPMLCECEANVNQTQKKKKNQKEKNNIQEIQEYNKQPLGCDAHAMRVRETAFNFNSFWDRYGKKVDRKRCEHTFDRLTLAEKKAIDGVVDLYVTQHPDVQFRKNPLSFLRGKCWQDEELSGDVCFSSQAEEYVATYLALFGKYPEGGRETLLDIFDREKKQGKSFDQMLSSLHFKAEREI